MVQLKTKSMIYFKLLFENELYNDILKGGSENKELINCYLFAIINRDYEIDYVNDILSKHPCQESMLTLNHNKSLLHNNSITSKLSIQFK